MELTLCYIEPAIYMGKKGYSCSAKRIFFSKR
jgi:hypothetical protein